VDDYENENVNDDVDEDVYGPRMLPFRGRVVGWESRRV
jgi:hypothetical protein